VIGAVLTESTSCWHELMGLHRSVWPSIACVNGEMDQLCSMTRIHRPNQPQRSIEFRWQKQRAVLALIGQNCCLLTVARLSCRQPHLILIRTKSVCGQRASARGQRAAFNVTLARPVLAELHTSQLEQTGGGLGSDQRSPPPCLLHAKFQPHRCNG